MRKRVAVSEVVSTIILAGAVLTIGSILWSYSLGARAQVGMLKH
jgi:hypothetical protein